jgi:Rrf2 family transcriptional regulator, nitric oxide-sensitive transcriptional repressor
MRLTVHTDYALRLLMALALDPARRHTIAEIASRYRISRNHLMKVAQTLVHGGFIDSLRGRGGGLKLRQSPDKIPLGAVVRITEDDFALTECFVSGNGTRCSVAAGCGLPVPLRAAMDAFFKVLDDYTLADILDSPTRLRQMRRLLGVSTSSVN